MFTLHRNRYTYLIVPWYTGLNSIIDRITTVQSFLDWFSFGWDRLLPADPYVYLPAYKLNETVKLLPIFYRDSFQS